MKVLKHKFVCTFRSQARCCFIYFPNESWSRAAGTVQFWFCQNASSVHLQHVRSGEGAGPLPESRRPLWSWREGESPLLHSSGPSMLLALYHYCSPAGECVAIDQQLARFAQPLIRWREREGSGKQEKRGWWGRRWWWWRGVRFTQAVSEPPLSLWKEQTSCGGGGGRGGRCWWWWWRRGGVT